MRWSNEEAEPFPKRPERQLLYDDAAVEVDIWAAIGGARFHRTAHCRVEFRQE